MSEREAKAATALEMAGKQREISVSEFFLKNRHLLGFDTPAKALVTAVKEAVDICIDARHAKAALKMQINKSDRNDAIGIARIMQCGWYREVRVLSQI